MELTVPMAYLRAIRLLTGKLDIRNYLNGVCITDGAIIGTNGHYLGVIETEHVAGAAEIIIPNEPLDAFFKLAGRLPFDALITYDADTRKGTLAAGSAVVQFTGEYGRYPAYKRAMLHHDRADGWLQFQWQYLALFEKVAVALGTKPSKQHKVTVLPSREMMSARVLIPEYPEFNGVCQPLRV